MNSPIRHLSLIAFLLGFALHPASEADAQPHGGGRGMPEELHGVIHQLFAGHEQIKRSVELSKTGYTAKTTSEDPELAKALQSHVSQMEKRLEGGLSVRRWDPAFVEFREHYEDLNTGIEYIKGGVAVSVTGTTPASIKVAHNHAKIISGFVKHGEERMHYSHPKAVTE
ncbi:MAG: hypothetical protein P1U81_03005 [Verrucomicrobiales bacterium]|nr:hypothetical protein [Verrucomicrobiales bacterium]